MTNTARAASVIATTTMIIKTATFVKSSSDSKSCPPPDRPEFAFIGRSNVGKSSLVNQLVGRKSLAKTSSTPGKTQTINHFIINDAWYLVDLPGYGYASVGRKAKAQWPAMIAAYLSQRSNLNNTFVLIDSRLEPQQIDREFIQWMGEHELPFSMVFTKADKLSISGVKGTIARWETVLRKNWSEPPPMFVTSAVRRTGTEDILGYVSKIMAAK